MAMQKADILADSLYRNIEPEGEIQLYCSKCPFKSNCPAVTKGADKQLPFNIKAQVSKLKKLQDAEKEIKKIKAEVLDFMAATNTKVAKVNDATVSLVTSSSDKYAVDVNKLRVEQPEIYAKYRTPSRSFTWLKIV